jgi:hypothetical protein
MPGIVSISYPAFILVTNLAPPQTETRRFTAVSDFLKKYIILSRYLSSMKNIVAFLLMLLFSSSVLKSQAFADSIDNRLLAAYYYFKKDYTTALSYFSKPARVSSYDLMLEIESLLLSGEPKKATVKLLDMCAVGKLDTSDIFSNPILIEFIDKNNLWAAIRKGNMQNTADNLTLEIYHLLQTDQLVRSGQIDEKTWVAIDTGYILPRLVAYLQLLIGCPTPQTSQYKGLSTILMHQARYANGYERTNAYSKNLYESGVLTPLDYAKIIDSYLLINNQGVQKYGTIILPRGNTGYIKVMDPENIDTTRRSIRLPPLSMDFNFIRLELDLPEWYTLQAKRKKN